MGAGQNLQGLDTTDLSLILPSSSDAGSGFDMLSYSDCLCDPTVCRAYQACTTSWSFYRVITAVAK